MSFYSIKNEKLLFNKILFVFSTFGFVQAYSIVIVYRIYKTQFWHKISRTLSAAYHRLLILSNR